MKPNRYLYFFGFLIVVLWVYSGLLDNSFITKPTMPNVSTGETLPYSVKGKTVYVTENERFLYRLTLFGSISGILIYIGAYFLIKKHDRKNEFLNTEEFKP